MTGAIGAEYDGPYEAIAYNTINGKKVANLPLVTDPGWHSGINLDGDWKVEVPLGQEGLDMSTAKSLKDHYRFSVAVIVNDHVCQAGPITYHKFNTDKGTLTLSGKGMWQIFNKRLLHHKDWNPLTQSLVGEFADVSFTDSLWNIARTLVRNGITYTHRIGSALPLAVPANSAAGTNERNYFGYDFKYIGAELHNLTDVENGPDILFQPYRINDIINHQMMVGEPYLTQTGSPVMLDYSTTLLEIDEDADSSNLAQSFWVKGTGDKRGTMYGWNGFNTLISEGFPLLDHVDTAHSDATQQETLSGWAEANQKLYGQGPLKSWRSTARIDGPVPLGSYLPGYRETLNIDGHDWIEDGQHYARLLEMGNSNSDGTVDLVWERQVA